MKLVHWQLMGGLLHLVQRGGDWAGPVYQSPYRPLLCGINVAIKRSRRCDVLHDVLQLILHDVLTVQLQRLNDDKNCT